MRPVRIALLNPNTNSATTQMMTEIAARALGRAARVEGRTVPFGPPIITTPAGLARAADEVLKTGRTLRHEGFDGILISGFGDPGLDMLREIMEIPVTGIAEASMAQAAGGGRRFSIVTTTPDLTDSIACSAHARGYSSFLVSVRITPGTAEATMADPQGMACALLKECLSAADADRAEAIIIGGGPLAIAAQAIATKVPVPLIEPVSAGARLAFQKIMERADRA